MSKKHSPKCLTPGSVLRVRGVCKVAGSQLMLDANEVLLVVGISDTLSEVDVFEAANHLGEDVSEVYMMCTNTGMYFKENVYTSYLVYYYELIIA